MWRLVKHEEPALCPKQPPDGGQFSGAILPEEPNIESEDFIEGLCAFEMPEIGVRDRYWSASDRDFQGESL